MIHFFLTRHGQCIHNLPGNNHLWKHANDDILGLTEQGVASTVEKADELSTRLQNDIPVVVMHTGAIRSRQTASLLASRLRLEHGFLTRLDEMPYPELFREFPCPTGHSPWSHTFSFDLFKADPTYNDNGWCESFQQRFKKHYHYAFNMQEGGVLDSLKKKVERGLSEEQVQVVLVSHHYTSCAFIGALVSNAQGGGYLEDTVIKNAHKFYLTHSEVLYLSPLLYRGCTEPFLSEWEYTRARLEAHVTSPTGIPLPNL